MGENSSPSPASPGRVVRVHLACRAALPIGTTLRVTGSHLWDPTETTGSPADPSDARKISTLMGRDAFRAGDSGFAGGSLGMGAANVVNEDEAAATGDGTMTPMGRDVVQPGGIPENGERVDADGRVLMGIHDGRSDGWYASSVEMVTCPDTYPLWRTRRPVVMVLTDPPPTSTKDASAKEGGDNNEPNPAAAVFHHHYRYLAVTPGAENDGCHGLAKLYGGSENDSMEHMLSRTKLSSGSLSHLGDPGFDAITSSGDGGARGFPVSLWENPFLATPEKNDGASRIISSEPSMSSAGALSVYSEATSVMQTNGGLDFDTILGNLPYRTLDIDVATASVVKSPPFADEKSLEYTEDGVLIDNWNGADDVTYRPYCVREGLRVQRHEEEEEEQTVSEAGAEARDEEKTPRRRIFIVCYHLPVMVSKDPDTGEWRAGWSESLLAKTSTGSFVSDAHRIGTITTSDPVTESDKEELRSLLAKMDCTVLFFDEATRDAHYKGFCKQALWLAFHHVDMLDIHDPAFSLDLDSTSASKPVDGTVFDLRSLWDQRQVHEWWEAFNVVNRAFAVEVAKIVRPGDVVWVHDYHLCLLPRMLGEEERRARMPRPTRKIFFLHIPFPVSMIFKELECGPSILEGMLSADVVGFHSFTEARHFLSCTKRILGLSHDSLEGGLIGVKYQKRTVVVTMSSVSIEPYMVDAVLQLPTTIDGEAALRTKHAGRTIIAGLDVAQYLSGIGPKLSIYERFLRDMPAWKDRVVLVQRCLIPGARRLDEARTIREVRTIVRRIQKKYGDAVIDYAEVFGSTLPVDQRLALWKASDCLLNTDLRCGLNLWPLEYVYAQKGAEVPGIVIASEFSDVFGVLNGALRISPYAIKDTVETIDKALTMGQGDREGRHLRDIEFVSTSSSAQWMQNVLRDLGDQSIDDQLWREEEGSERRSSSEVPSVAEFLVGACDEQFTRLDPRSIMSAYQSTSRRVIILDFNGTIVIKEAVDSFLKRDAIGSAGDAPPEAVCQSLAKLCADPQNTVFVVSGDGHQNVTKAIGNIPGLGLAASNGSCFSPPLSEGEATRTWLALDLGVDWDSVRKVALPIMSKFTARTNGSFIKLAHSSIGWSYYSCDPEFGSLQAKYLVMELERELAPYEVRFVNLKGIVEVIPRRLNKGIIVKKILRDIAARDGNAGVDFILCMGDDVSDEKMFTSVFSFVSEMDEDYRNVVPSPSVSQLTSGTLLASQSFLMEPQSVRCKDLSSPMFAFTAAVGKKPSHASQYVDGAEDVADLLVKMATGSADAFFRREKEGDRQLKKFSSR